MVQDIQEQIGANVRKLRLKHGLTQDIFADRSGLNRAHIGEIERGESNVTIQTLKIIADTLGVKIRQILPEPEYWNADGELVWGSPPGCGALAASLGRRRR